MALYTSGEREYSYVLASANTEQGLAARVAEYLARRPSGSTDQLSRDLRWSTPDWKYHDFCPALSSLELPTPTSLQRDSARYQDFVYALKAVATSLPPPSPPRVYRLITCGDMSPDFFLRGLRLLNPDGLVEAYLAQFTPTSYLAQLAAMPASTRLGQLVDLLRDLSLDLATPLAVDARSHHLDVTSLDELIAREGGAADRLLDLVEEFGLKQAFTAPDSPERSKYGAFTPHYCLATHAAFLVAECPHASDDLVLRIQQILARRLAADAGLPRVGTLAENLARVLHTLRPQKFPASVLDPNTNALRNPAPFLPGGILGRFRRWLSPGR